MLVQTFILIFGLKNLKLYSWEFFVMDPYFFHKSTSSRKVAKKSSFCCDFSPFLVDMYKKIIDFNKNIDFLIQNDISPPKKGKNAIFKKS